jgi:hypothetical protein
MSLVSVVYRVFAPTGSCEPVGIDPMSLFISKRHAREYAIFMGESRGRPALVDFFHVTPERPGEEWQSPYDKGKDVPV